MGVLHQREVPEGCGPLGLLAGRPLQQPHAHKGTVVVLKGDVLDLNTGQK